MKIKINSSKVVRSLPKEFKAIAQGYVNQLPNTSHQPGDKIIIKEYTGIKFTGKEILAVVTKVTKKIFDLRNKQSSRGCFSE